MKCPPLAASALLVCAGLLVTGAVNATPRGDTVKPEPDTPEMKEARRLQAVADIPKWLPRLVGRFNYEGVVQFFQTMAPGAQSLKEAPQGLPPKTYADGTCDEDACQSLPPNVRTAKGKGDCITYGSGVGVQCVINVVWDEEWSSQGTAVEGGVSFLGPAATLYGFDPNTATIRYLMLNTNGIAQSESGKLNGDRLTWTFETRCESGSTDHCRQVIRVYIPPDGKAPQTSIDLEKLSSGTWVTLTRFSMDMHRVAQAPAGTASKASPPGKMAPGQMPPPGQRKH